MKKKTNRLLPFISALLLAAAVFSLTALPASAMIPGSLVPVTLGAQRIDSSGARLIDGTTYVPLRSFSAALGATAISYDTKAATATVYSDGLRLTATEGQNYIIANGRYLYNDAGVKILADGKMYVPVRTLVKAFGGEVVWDDRSGSVSVIPGTGAIESGDDYYDEDELYWLSRIINAESRGESLIGQIAVGNVVQNRVADSSFPDTIYGVVFDQRFGITQFTPVAIGTVYITPSEQSVIAAKIVLDGYSVSDSALYFYDPVYATTTWMEYSCSYLFTIGCHRFFA